MYKINKDIPTIQIFISFFLRSTDGRIRCEKCSTAECRMEMKDQRFLTTNISLTISENLKKIKVFSYGTKVIICFESCVNFGKSKICLASSSVAWMERTGPVGVVLHFLAKIIIKLKKYIPFHTTYIFLTNQPTNKKCKNNY